jgi:uncharacterized protein YbjT (DUF2867 family)
MTRILITGGRGVLGSALTPQLLEAGHKVYGTSRHAQQNAASRVEWRQLDLSKGIGLAEAVAGVDVIVHAASDPVRANVVDVEGTGQLLQQAKAAGVSHFVYVSIVGIDRIPFSYYRHKLAAEQLVEAGGIPWSIVRITQFHALIDRALKPLTRLPVAFLPTDFQFQLISPDEAAQATFQAVQAGPSERLPDVGGPEVATLGDLVSPWLAARGERRTVWCLPIPGQVADGFRKGYNTCPDHRYGKITWAEWLAETYASSQYAVSSPQ